MLRIIMGLGGIFEVTGSNNKKGQVAILVALVFTFLFILFAFVVDYTQLINNKINLQLAADAAAYAGAAWQARILNRISAVNYHIRQDIKEFAMRAQVTHLRHNRGFPRGSNFINGGRQLAPVEPFMCQQAHGYVSISGLPYQQDTNLCRNASPTVGGLPPIVVPPVIAKFDPFAVAISQQIRRIQQEADRECRAAASDNQVLANHLIATYTQRLRFHAQQIQELERYLNSISGQNIANSSHPLLRTAYNSALRNLILSNNDDFRIEVLEPRGGRYLQLEPIQMRGRLFYFDFQVRGSGCVGIPATVPFDSMLAGFSKTKDLVTYFAVKLSAKPRLFFMPAAWVTNQFPELVAVAAAKPFGSRIGPDPLADNLLPVQGRPGNNNPEINFSWIPNDNLGIRNAKLLAYFDALHPFNSKFRPDGKRQTGWPEPRGNQDGLNALKAIRAPTVFDALFYSVFPDPGANKDTDYAPSNPNFAEILYPDYLEAADVSNPDRTLETPTPRTPAYFPPAVGSRNRGPGWIQINATRTNASGPYSGYAEEEIPTHSVISAMDLPILEGNQEKLREFGFATPDQIHSGWTSQGPGKRARIGYSVKFISTSDLYNFEVVSSATGTSTRIANPPIGDPNVILIPH